MHASTGTLFAYRPSTKKFVHVDSSRDADGPDLFVVFRFSLWKTPDGKGRLFTISTEREAKTEFQHVNVVNMKLVLDSTPFAFPAVCCDRSKVALLTSESKYLTSNPSGNMSCRGPKLGKYQKFELKRSVAPSEIHPASKLIKRSPTDSPESIKSDSPCLLSSSPSTSTLSASPALAIHPRQEKNWRFVKTEAAIGPAGIVELSCYVIDSQTNFIEQLVQPPSEGVTWDSKILPIVNKEVLLIDEYESSFPHIGAWCKRIQNLKIHLPPMDDSLFSDMEDVISQSADKMLYAATTIFFDVDSPSEGFSVEREAESRLAVESDSVDFELALEYMALRETFIEETLASLRSPLGNANLSTQSPDRNKSQEMSTATAPRPMVIVDMMGAEEPSSSSHVPSPLPAASTEASLFESHDFPHHFDGSQDVDGGGTVDNHDIWDDVLESKLQNASRDAISRLVDIPPACLKLFSTGRRSW